MAIIFILSNFYPTIYPYPEQRFNKWMVEDSIELNYGIIQHSLASEFEPFSQAIYDSISRFTNGFKLHISNKKISAFFTPVISIGGGKIYPRRKWKNLLSGGIIQGGLFLKTRHFTLTLGRTILPFSTSPLASPILSLDAPPIPLLSYSIFFGNITITQLTGFLGEYKGTLYDSLVNPDDTISLNRYLIIHRFETRPFKNLGLGFTEMGIVASSGAPPGFFNPITILYEEQFNDGNNMNILWNFDHILKIKKFIWYSNLLIDDFQYEKDPWNEPNHMGINTGFILKYGGLSFLIEYNRFTRWVYGHFYPYQRYTYREFPLGMNPSSDFENLIFRIKRGIFTLHLEMKNQGETTPFTPWPVDYTLPPSESNSFPENNFLSGTIERTYSIRTETTYKKNTLLILLKTGIIYSKNHCHNSGEDKIFPEIMIGIKGRLELPEEEK